MIGGGHPLLRENLAYTDLPLAKRYFYSIFACSASATTTAIKLTLLESPLALFNQPKMNSIR